MKIKNGQALVEFALLLPALIMILISICWYSRVLITRQQLVIAARYGTDLIRHMNMNEAEVSDEIKNYFKFANVRKLDTNRLAIKVKISPATPPPDMNPPASWVEVNYKFYLPAMFGGKEFWVSGRSEVLNDTLTIFYENHS
ncbi:MAG: hypothetical protein A2297_06600 [Elusimicrobia bacterium RIFOXYB2_FULL_48_7]|nr:MAG: hypothetical protein A2297_06600 [Elusimicrobia bacterium RIFOXYB2_FULL_48_7]